MWWRTLKRLARRRRTWMWAGGITVALALIILLQFVPLQPVMEKLRGWVDALGPRGPVAFVLAFIVLTSLLLPGWPLNVLGGVLFGALWGGFLTSLASTLAAAVPFLISRYLAHDFVMNSARRYPKFDALYRALGEEANWKIVAAVRLSHALPYGLQNYLLGLTPVRLVPYVLTTCLISLPGIFMIAYLGDLGTSGVQASDGWGGWLLRGAGFLVAAAAIFYLGRLVRRALRRHTKAIKGDEKEPALAEAGENAS
jgi:uncharacterized membrane protein YdjX (TVP38/TMEM64 family)